MSKIDPALLFSQCEFFIDYRSSKTGCDRSLRLGSELEKNYGANIVEYPRSSSTTHIIFKNGNLETKLFGKKYNIPLIDPIWLEYCTKKRRLIKYDKYLVVNDENQQPTEELNFNQLIISNKDLIAPSTPKNREQFKDLNNDSGKKTKKILYTPVRGEFDQGNPEEYFDHQNRIITLDDLGMNLQNDNHMLIHRYGCSVARRQIQENCLPQKELNNQPSIPIKQEELLTTMSIPSQSQSQSSTIIHFANNVRQAPTSTRQILLSPSTTFDFDSQRQYDALGIRPQSTPNTSARLQEILIEKTLPNPKEQITQLKTTDYSSFTKISPLKTKPTIQFEICHDENEEENPNFQEIINQIEIPETPNQIELPETPNQIEIPETPNQIIPRPPPLLALSQAIQRKYPEQIINTKLNQQLPSIKDLPNSPANYSFVFYGFTLTQLEEAKRLTRRMGDCFSYELIDMTTTHVILPDDDPQIVLTLEVYLAFIYGCRFVTFEWLKSSSHIGEWLNVNKFEPKRFYQTNPSLNIYRKFRQQQKPFHLFNECGRIYLTSIAKQRSLLLKLITLLGGNITVNRNLANIIVGQSSKKLPIIIYSHVTEEWVIDSIKLGGCLPTDDYLIE